MRSVLQGRPFKHPLHPMLVHMPVALFPLSLLLDLCAFGFEQNWQVRAAFYAMLTGVIAALMAAVPGFVDYLDIRRDSHARRIANWHMGLNLALVGAYAVNLWLRSGPALEAAQPPVWPVVLSVIGVMVLMVSGYLGGILVYDDGVAVGRHRRGTPLPDETLRPTGSLDTEGYIPVADGNDLPEGQTLRANVNGTVVALARVEGTVYAFQEFCTHRFGPLSQGCFVNGQVMCPWHRSQFDVRTGKVTEGPAKVDLKTFAVKEEGGKIYVRVGNDGA